MATYTTLKIGSQGADVEKMQQAFADAGYDIDVDGIFGEQTDAVVRKYQQDHGLDVDGMAGEQTLGKLYQNTQAAPTTTKSKATTTAAAPDYSDYEYDASTDEAYLTALAALQEAEKNMPSYAGTYDAQLEDIYDKIVNREKFKYDVNSDALYQQLAAQYQQQGKMAMEDTMGQAAAMTGGYGNSYAVSAGNQAYQGYLQKLNDMVPELHDAALARYNAEGDALLDEYALTEDLRDEEYGRYIDSLNQYWQNVDRKQDQVDTAYDRGRDNWYTAYQMGVDADNTRYEREQYEQETAYGKQQDAYSKLVSLITTTGYTPSAKELTAAGMSSGEAAAYADYYKKQNVVSSDNGGDNPGGDDPSNGGGSYYNGGLDSSIIKSMQQALGVTADGMWGQESMAAAKAKWGVTSAADAYAKYGGGTIDYSDWDAGDWQGYFANIRQSEGADAAKTELKYFTDKGLIPKNMLSYASIGARGSLGH